MQKGFSKRECERKKLFVEKGFPLAFYFIKKSRVERSVGVFEDNVVTTAFDDAGRGNERHTRFFVQGGNVRYAAVAHGRFDFVQALCDVSGEVTCVRDV